MSILKTVSVAYKKRGPGRLRWVEASAPTAREAYRLVADSEQVKRIRSEGFREYGIIGLGKD